MNTWICEDRCVSVPKCRADIATKWNKVIISYCRRSVLLYFVSLFLSSDSVGFLSYIYVCVPERLRVELSYFLSVMLSEYHGFKMPYISKVSACTIAVLSSCRILFMSIYNCRAFIRSAWDLSCRSFVESYCVIV